MGVGFENTFEFLIKQSKSAAQGFEEEGAVRPFAGPEPPAKDFTEDELLKMFDRKDFEDTYSQAVTSGETEDIHADMMIPSLKNDIVAGVHRDTYLRHHANRIHRFIAEADRRLNHAENVHPKRKEAIILFEDLEPVKGPEE